MRWFESAAWCGGTTEASFRRAGRSVRLACCAVLGACAAAGGASPPNPQANDAGADDAFAADASSLSDASSLEESDATPGAAADAFEAPGIAVDARDARPRERLPAPDPYPRPSYVHLAETGFFAEGNTSIAPASDLLAFEPTYKLWSDAAAKRRWLRLPPGTSIDTSDMDHWIFPVGTKIWKEFSADGVLIETRMIERYGIGAEDYWMGSFVWNGEQTDAVLAVDGQQDINGTTHDAPPRTACGSCHRGDAGRILGLSAMQLARDDHGPTLRDLDRAELLTVSPNFPIGLTGEPGTIAALGYLHANCGHRHNERGTAWPDTQMVLRLRVSEHEPTSSDLYRSTVGVETHYWRGGAIANRITAGDPDASAIIARMKIRVKDQMPPLATEQVDEAGLQVVRDFIAALPH